MTTTHKRSAGFTLIELLIVLAIIITLFIFLVPTVLRGYQQYLARQAEINIRMIQGQLEVYLVDNKRYPTTEEGLYALIYIPDNVGVVPAMQPGGMPGTGDPTTMDPSLTGGMLGQSASTGPEALTNQNPLGQPGVPGGDPMGQPTLPGSNMGGAMDPTTGLPMTDPMGGTAGTGMLSTWNQPYHNPQLYRQQPPRTRSTPYIALSDLTDPWGQPYRYDASMTYYGANQYTGESRPAIWSAGRDKQDGTDDDIRNWNPAEVPGLLMQRQQQAQMQQQGGQFGTQSIGAESLQMDLNNPMMSQPGMPQPGMPQPGMPQPGMPQPGMPQPGMPQPGMPQPGMPQPGMPQPGMPQPGMPQPGMPQTGMPQTGMPQTGF